MSGVTAAPVESRETFACFGSECTVIVADDVRPGDAASAAAMAKRRLLEWHEQFSRFEPDSELSRLNRDPHDTVPVSPMMRRVVQAAVKAAVSTDGLVDVTLAAEIEDVGYEVSFDGKGLPLALALALAPPRSPGRPRAAAGWHSIEVDRRRGTVTRPPGVRIDVGGIAKGVFADELAAMLSGFAAYAIDCAGDLRVGGRAGSRREVHVESPFDGSIVHTLELSASGVATSGIGRRSWLRPDGRSGHHLLDPRTGEPAFTGVVQVTALAPTAAQAESLSKAAILSGPEGAAGWLAFGGVIVLDDGGVVVVDGSDRFVGPGNDDGVLVR
jgi:thiamine biosynthesis lipoprotein